MEHDERPECEWFAMCDNRAIGTLPHPVIGPVPICERCANLVGQLDKVDRY